MLTKAKKRDLLQKIIKQFKQSPCLWKRENICYYNKQARDDALLVLLKIWNCYEKINLAGLKAKLQGLRAVYRRERKKVESSAAASGHYKPTLWYYKHLNFLSGNNDPVSGDSDSEHNEDTVYVQVPRAKKRPAARATSISQPAESETSVDASAAAFGRSVGAQLHHLSRMQRCIAEKLISDVIYHAKMEQLSMDTIIDVKEPADTTVNLVSPEAATSWYGTETAFERQRDLDQASSSHTVDTIEDRLKREIEETESAVNFIKMESDDAENYCFQDVEEQNNAIDIIKEELM